MHSDHNVYRDHLARAVAFIRQSIDREFRVKDAAAVVRLSPWHFVRVFRLAFGETPMQMRDRLRVERAMELLAMTDDDLATIAPVVGFRDRAHLCLCFRRVKGMTPAAYRRGMKGMT